MTALTGALQLGLLGLLIGYILPSARVVQQIAKLRANQAPLSIEGQLSLDGLDALESVGIEVHPELGSRVHDATGGRWLLRHGRVVAGSQIPAPAWVPDLEILVLRREEDLVRWLGDAGIDPRANELVRCGEQECFVLGTRAGRAQLWVEKESFEIRRIQQVDGRILELGGWRSWSGSRFPSEVGIFEAELQIATLSIEAVRTAQTLSEADLSPSWVQAAPASAP